MTWLDTFAQGHLLRGAVGRGPEVGATRGVGEWSLGNGDLELGKERRKKEAVGGGERGSRMSGETPAGFYIFLILMKIDCTNSGAQILSAQLSEFTQQITPVEPPPRTHSI